MATAAEPSQLVVLLRKLDAASLPIAGGKAAQLGALMQAGLPVPDGFCITTAAYRGGMSAALKTQIAQAYGALGGAVDRKSVV